MNRILLILSLLLASTMAEAQVDVPSTVNFPYAKVGGVQEWRPHMQRRYDWNDNTAVWDSTEQFFHTFSNGTFLPTNVLVQTWNNGFEDALRTSSTYYPDGSLDVQVNENWNGSQWELTWRWDYEYDNMGNRSSLLNEQWNGNAWDTASYQLDQYTYDSQGRITRLETKVWDVNTSQLVDLNAHVYTFGSGPGWDSHTLLHSNSATWDTLSEVYDIVWEDFSENWMKSFYVDQWVNGQRRPNYRSERSFGQYGSYEQIDLVYRTAMAAYDTSSKTIINFNAQGDQTDYFEFIYIAANGSWDLFDSGRYLLSYDANDNLTEWISQYPDYPTAPYVNYRRIEYLDFALDAPKATALNSQVKWAAHPVGQTGSLLVEVDRPGILALELTNMEGRKVKSFTTPHRGGKQIHDFNLDLPAGLYLYQVRLNGAGACGKLLVK